LSAVTSTLLFRNLVGGWSSALSPYMVKVSRGSMMLSLDWAAFVLSAAAMVFWLFSSCCVSGKSKYRGSRDKRDQNSVDRNAGVKQRNFPGFGSRGYQELDDQEKSLIVDSEVQNQQVESQDTSYGGAALGEHAAGASPPSVASGPYKGRDASKYEPYRSQV
jgi:hypothetical protein